MKQLILRCHNHKCKLCKGENGLVKFVHVEVEYLAGGIVLQLWHNLKFDQSSILWKSFLFFETLNKQKLTWGIFITLNINKTSRVYYFYNKSPWNYKKSYTKCGEQYTDKYLFFFSIASRLLKTSSVASLYMFLNVKKQKSAFISKWKKWQINNYITWFFLTSIMVIRIFRFRFEEILSVWHVYSPAITWVLHEAFLHYKLWYKRLQAKL